VSNTEDVRTKVSPEDRAFLDAVALASQTDSATIVRGLIVKFLEAKRHEYTVALRITYGQGIDRSSQGNHT
jgi:hypothetical protein